MSRQAKRAAGSALSLRNPLSQATEAVGMKVSDGRLYFCVIDQMQYGSLDMALVHLKMQHGVAIHGDLLLRAKMIGGSH